MYRMFTDIFSRFIIRDTVVASREPELRGVDNEAMSSSTNDVENSSEAMKYVAAEENEENNTNRRVQFENQPPEKTMHDVIKETTTLYFYSYLFSVTEFIFHSF